MASATLPGASALPTPLKWLSEIEGIELTDDHWDTDLQHLIRYIEGAAEQMSDDRRVALTLAVERVLEQ